jgi:hypothetical protein
MTLPVDRTSFKQWCLRKLGAPVINIEIDEDQLDDRVDEAFLYFMDYHFEGSDKIYYKYQVTQNDITNRSIKMPDNIIGVVDLFDIGQSLNTNNIFNIRYQIALNDLYTLTSVSMVPYFMAMQHIQFLELMLVGKQPLRYTRSKNILYIDMSWDLMNVGDYVIVVAYQVIDPDVYTRAWSNRWLLKYGTAITKQQWGNNIKKYGNMPIPGGVIFNGQQIYDEATKEKEELVHELIHSWSLSSVDMIG